MVQPFRFGLLGASAPTMALWRMQAREAESLGYSVLYIHDHLDPQYGPLVAATVAAEATTVLGVGTLVLNNDLRNTVVLAREIATLGLAAEGRVEVGLGAGYQPSDYLAAGIDLQAPGIRVSRLEESVGVLKALWAGEHVTFDGAHIHVRDAQCEPRPELPPRLIIGGANTRILNMAVREGDIVGVNRMAPPDPSTPLAQLITTDHYDRCLAIIRAAAGERAGSLELQIALTAVKVAQSDRAARRAGALLGFPEESLDSPAVAIGTLDAICERLVAHRERWGFSNIVVPAESMTEFAPVVARMAGA